MMFRTTTITCSLLFVTALSLSLSLSNIATAEAKTAVLFGATGAVGNDVLRAIIAKNENIHFFTKVILVGRRQSSPVVIDALPQSSSELPEVVQIEVQDLGDVDQNDELAAMETDACFVAVGAAFPHLSDLHDWHSVEVTMTRSMVRLCAKMNATSITVFTAIDSELAPEPFTNKELTKTGTPLGWWPVLVGSMHMMGLKEKVVISNTKAAIPFVRLFQPANIITKEIRYGWLDWILFKFHGVFNPYLPTRYHSVTTELLAKAMVRDAVNILSGRTTTTATADDADEDGATRFTYGDFLRIAGEDVGEKHTEL